MATRKHRRGKRPRIPAALKKFIRVKLATAKTGTPLTKQAPDWFDELKRENAKALERHDLDDFIKLVYRLRAKKSRQRKTKRVAAAVPAVTRPEPKTPAPKLMTTFVDALQIYDEYVKLVPRLAQAEAFIRQSGLVMVVVDGKATLQLKK